ncbi:enoyl-CoA hydratase/isomerase family protein [Allopusillimonas soli]|uniref:Enoyl-CoA hydratase/isomerase family protein n=1 Tax=Allopusillimonas soli TaxID=659016 RepID=A0A853F8H5_9BURK|nr:enoyl-CoA hydratase-related protein [Allopusillimonas soli]NYT36403.1 enoyl-CoA hydratase/isomerase family protein [Allopusillimonas soli]TEA74915.1 enoyl-CoA hydratase/isomerase family protein [Allopusillimonas soli]
MSLIFSVENHVATITLNRPEALNAIDPEARQELKVAWSRIHQDDDIRVAILTGAGEKSFCTGSDLKKTMPPKESFAELTFGRAESDHLLAGLDTDKPLICAINGYAMGGGLELALACDIRIASENAQFALSEVRLGSIPGAGGTQRLPRAIGISDAMLLMLTGDRISAQEALRVGLVSKIVNASELLSTAREIAARIAANAPLSVRAIKRLVYQGMDMPLPSALDHERFAFGLMRDTQDRLEGRRAFKEKRQPDYKGC